MRRVLVGYAIAVLVLPCILPGSSLAQQPEGPVRVAGAVYLGDAPTVIAETQGFFDQQGLSVKTSFLESGRQTMARLRQGEADFALTALTPFVLDRLADPSPGGTDDPVIIASLVHSNDLLQMVYREDAGISQPSDWRGKRIAINRGTNTEFVWWLYEQYHQLEPGSVTLLHMDFSDMPAALAQGRVDGALLWEPRVSQLDSRHDTDPRGDLKHVHLSDLYVGKWVIVTSRRTARERSDLCRNLLIAYKQAIKFIEGAPDLAVAEFGRQLGFNDNIDPGHWNALDYDINLDWSLIAGLQEQFEWARAAGYGRPDDAVRILDLLEAGPLYDEWPGAVGIPLLPGGQAAP